MGTTQSKIIAARRIDRLAKEKEALHDFLSSDNVKDGKHIDFDYGVGKSIRIYGLACDMIVAQLKYGIEKLKSEIDDIRLE